MLRRTPAVHIRARRPVHLDLKSLIDDIEEVKRLSSFYLRWTAMMVFLTFAGVNTTRSRTEDISGQLRSVSCRFEELRREVKKLRESPR